MGMDPKQVLRRGQTIVLTAPPHRWRFGCWVDALAPDRITLVAVSGDALPDGLAPGLLVVGYVPTPVRVYQFESIVLQAQAQPHPTVVVAMPDALTPVQRRRYFRVEALFPVALAPKDDPDAAPLAVTGVDISAGGVGVLAERAKEVPAWALQVGNAVRVTVTLKPIEGEVPHPVEVNAVGEIVWVTRTEHGWRMGIAFVDIDPKARERIVAWCFAFQRHLLRLGLLPTRGHKWERGVSG